MHSIYYNYLVTLIARVIKGWEEKATFSLLCALSRLFFIRSVLPFGPLEPGACFSYAVGIYNLHSLENCIKYSGISITKYNVHSVSYVYAVLPFYDVKCLCSGGQE